MLNIFKKKDSKPTYSASRFWATDYDLDYGWDDLDTDDDGSSFGPVKTSTEKSTLHYLKLNAHRRAISNFVNILTNKNIPVVFKAKGDSYTDGQTVTISSDMKPDKFDSTVGLALHEASHILLTNFDTFVKYKANPDLVKKYAGIVENYDDTQSSHREFTNDKIFGLVKNITNYVEDRRIDNYVYNSCPGYRDYYKELYRVYFNDAMIDKGLVSDEFTTETIDSYMFRIINLTNPNTDLNKLRGLRAINRLVDLNNIDRIKSTAESVEIAEKIVDTILQSIIDEKKDEENGNGKQGAKDGPKGNSEQGDDDDDDLEVEFDDSDDDSDENESGGGSASFDGKLSGKVKIKPSKNQSTSGTKLSDANLKKLEKAIQKQKDFIDGKIKKKELTSKDTKQLKQIEQSGTEMVNVGGDTLDGGIKVPQVQTIVVKKLTEELMLSDEFQLANKDYRTKRLIVNESMLEAGLRLGNLLGKRLQIRSEERETVFNRQQTGRIDRRLVSSLGFDYQNVFYTKEVDKFKKVILHISIDASGSMQGARWKQAMTTAIALCKAATMVSNLDVQISIRSTIDSGTTASCKPYVVMAYDSRFDKFSKVKQLVAALTPGGITPEGLCFQAIMNTFCESSNGLESYFLNISDGEPNYSDGTINYAREIAEKHTAKMVKQIRERGISVMSYFVTDNNGWGGNYSKEVFKRMYGNSSRFIDVNGLVPITKTLNELFLKKS